MSKMWLGSIVAIILVLGGGYYYWQNTQGEVTFDPNKPYAISGEVGGGTSNSSSLTDLIASKKAQKCTVKHEVAGIESNGTVYVAGGKLRGDFVSTGGASANTHVIVDGDNVYTWIDGMGMGVKVATDSAAGASAQQAVSMNQKLNYDCTNWSVDASVFTRPSGITFSEPGAMIPKLPAGY
ncbi:MAG: hypothetical protein KBC48_00935 [Candidatus Pacebacteria bacterium]|nr:hypothetical protein [Candidatus Paceibacterota bacterium]